MGERGIVVGEGVGRSALRERRTGGPSWPTTPRAKGGGRCGISLVIERTVSCIVCWDVSSALLFCREFAVVPFFTLFPNCLVRRLHLVVEINAVSSGCSFFSGTFYYFS